MSAKKKGSRLMLFVGLFIVSLFLIFFVGTSIDKETGKSHNIITTNGLLHFKKGLDIAGGVRLTYKIDFSKHEDSHLLTDIFFSYVTENVFSFVIEVDSYNWFPSLRL